MQHGFDFVEFNFIELLLQTDMYVLNRLGQVSGIVRGIDDREANFTIFFGQVSAVELTEQLLVESLEFWRLVF